LKNVAAKVTSQKKQYANPDHRISFGALSELPCLSKYADCLAVCRTLDEDFLK